MLILLGLFFIYLFLKINPLEKILSESLWYDCILSTINISQILLFLFLLKNVESARKNIADEEALNLNAKRYLSHEFESREDIEMGRDQSIKWYQQSIEIEKIIEWIKVEAWWFSFRKIKLKRLFKRLCNYASSILLVIFSQSFPYIKRHHKQNRWELLYS